MTIITLTPMPRTTTTRMAMATPTRRTKARW
jgi:hypothetical protein